MGPAAGRPRCTLEGYFFFLVAFLRRLVAFLAVDRFAFFLRFVAFLAFLRRFAAIFASSIWRMNRHGRSDRTDLQGERWRSRTSPFIDSMFGKLGAADPHSPQGKA